MNNAVLFLTQSIDRDIPTWLASALRPYELDVFRVDINTIGNTLALTDTVNDDGRRVLRFGDVERDATSFKAAMLRTSPLCSGVAGYEPAIAAGVLSETNRSIFDLCNVVDDSRWLVPAGRVAAAGKMSQLVAAHRHGFKIAPTCTTTDPTQAHAFVSRLRAAGRDVIIKSPSSLFPTQRLAVALDDEVCASVAQSPLIFQPALRHAYELRVTVIDDEVFAARIDYARDVIDWRHAPAASLTATTIADSLAQRCRALAATLGLAMTAVEFIVDDDDTHWFLEANVFSEWGMFDLNDEQRPITAAIARALARRARA